MCDVYLDIGPMNSFSIHWYDSYQSLLVQYHLCLAVLFYPIAM